MKRFVIFVVMFCMLLGATPVFAYKIPSSFWQIEEKYQAAVNANDYPGIIEYANQEVNLMRNEPENEQVLQILGSRIEKVALAYEAMENYPMAAEYFEKYVYYAEALKWDDAVKIAKAKALHYRPRLEIFEQVEEEQVFFNAINEPHVGVLFGATSDGAIRDRLKDESIILLYHEFGSTGYNWLHVVFKQAKEKNIRVEFALNVPNEGDDIRRVTSSGAYLDSLLNELKKYPTVPVYFRFAAEVNIWNNRCTPDEFITAFRFIADKVHRQLPNAAMVWSVNQSSSWDLNMHDYYPGDQYVDWVGVSSYLSRYFLGRNDWSPEESFYENVFFAGDSADAVLALEEIVTTYGNRKPIMLAESGVAHFINSLDKDETKWAIDHLHQQYEYLPKVYPQIKAIIYFDRTMSNEVNDYALSDNNALANEYLEEIKHSYFIHGSDENAEITYHKVTDITTVSDDQFVFGVYPHVYKNTTPKVDLYFDGYYLTSLNTPHYLGTLDLSGEREGLHTLKLVIDGVIEKEYQLDVVKPIRLYLNEKRLNSDVPPIIMDGRTLVPVRIITENLNAQVQWNADTREVTVTKGDISIVLGIDCPDVLVNGVLETIDVSPQIIDGRTMVPIRFLSENFHLDVSWDDITRSVYLSE